MSDDQKYHYHVIRRAIDEIDAAEAPLTLEALAARMSMSPAHFQRVFTQWVGVSPKRYQQYLALDHARTLLRDRFTTLETAGAVGLSGSSRLHDLFLTWEAMSPGAYASGGKGLTIRWGWFDSPFGLALVMATERGICGLGFAEETGAEPTMADLRSRWPNAELRGGPVALQPMVDAAFGGRGPGAAGADRRAVPAQGVGGASEHPLGPRDHLFGDRACHRPPKGGARGRHGGGAQPGLLADPLPPGGAQIRRAWRLSLGPAGQARDPRPGNGGARRGRLSPKPLQNHVRPVGRFPRGAVFPLRALPGVL
jgi:AraC family transcriptional regulator of adaptative response/methylated-DNA-[protein]-cysteine methyltransferase